MVVPQKGGIRDEWQRVRVSAVASAVIGGTPSRRVAEYWRGTIPWVTAKDIANTSGRYVEQAHEYITEKGLKSSSAKRMPEGTVIITARGTVGALAQLRQDMAFNQTCYALVPHDGLDNDFLFYALKGTADAMRALSYGTVFETITTRTFSQWQIPLPPLPEQRAIAHLLGTLDDKIALNRRMNATLDEMARALFTSWFINFDPVQAKAALTQRASPGGSAWPVARAYLDRLEPALAAVFPDSFVDSELGPIPAGWTVKPLGECFNLTMGQSPPGSTYNEHGEGLPFFQGRADFGFRYPTNRKYCAAPTRFAEPDDTLVSVRAPVGDINLAWGRSCIGRGIAALRHQSGSSSFTYHSVWAMQQELRQYEDTGTVFGAITKNQFETLMTLEPNWAVIDGFHSIAGEIDARIRANVYESRTLAALRDTLLPKLLSGQIRVHAGSPPS